ncbi:FMN-dependent NADH-azoreductase [Atopomonas sediminilitoris]|uniref:FMN-dependent NADH-azoreductase n=1 Tax=Atopomonas sediminilitoris TaxID=2919919 RepID=UPI001F4DE7D3|nr:NAD(P)H-dependent oxidoreductase [Atopomonas sediminilitoris]MCJ8170047.1 NAD(P)H-dependent oxidoreductase [Atopomonas sediminilitoris]
MSKLLIVQSSARQEGSVSRELTQRFTDQWLTQQPHAQVVVRDLAQEPLPHLDLDLLAAWTQPRDTLSDTQQHALARSDAAIAELQAADVLLLAVPMYNFGIPSTLKAWLDHVARAGVTFKYTEQGPVGLLTGKRAVVLTARGGVHAGQASDHQEGYLKFVLGFLGIHDVQFIHAEGQSMGEQAAAQGVRQAQAELASLI